LRAAADECGRAQDNSRCKPNSPKSNLTKSELTKSNVPALHEDLPMIH
jgi:hypothetical protein